MATRNGSRPAALAGSRSCFRATTDWFLEPAQGGGTPPHRGRFVGRGGRVAPGRPRRRPPLPRAARKGRAEGPRGRGDLRPPNERGAATRPFGGIFCHDTKSLPL